MIKQNHMTRGGRYGVAALLLLGTSVAAIAQQATPPAAGDMMVTADTATHTAALTGTGEGTAWFFADEQNNSIRWTIEYTGVEPTGASIMCPGPADAAAGDVVAEGTTAGLMGPITMVDRTGATPAAGADAGAGGGAGMTPAAPAAGMDAGAMAAGDMTGLVEAVNLLDEGGTMTSPLEGQTADLGEETFAHIAAGACFLDLVVATAGGAGATPATPAMPAVPPAP